MNLNQIYKEEEAGEATKHGSSRFPSQAYGTSVRLTALYGPLQQGSELQVVPT